MTQEEIQSKLKEIVQRYIPEPESVEEINEDTDFLEDLQINSAHLIDIILDVEDAFDIEISDEEAEEMLTVEKTVNLIEKKLAE